MEPPKHQHTTGGTRQAWAFVLGGISLLCTTGWYLAYGIAVLLLQNADQDGPPFSPGIVSVLGFLLTFPPAMISTLVALMLVGWRKSKLAWISFCVYVIPFALAVLTAD